jgi:hypothetical protein
MRFVYGVIPNLCQRAFGETLRSIIRWVIEQMRSAAMSEEKSC